MIIKENWFYDLSNYNDNEIIIENWVTASIYDSWKISKNIYLKQNSFVDFFGFLKEENNYTICFFQNEENSNLKVRYLLFSSNDFLIKSKIHSKISSNNSKSDVKIFSIIWEKWNIDLDWIIEIDSWFEKIVWHLLEENLFLWNTWKIKWIPTLLVRSDDVEASHACKIERISEKNLFYLKSRWIQEQTAYYLLLEANIKSLFSCLSMVNLDFYENLLKETTSLINQK